MTPSAATLLPVVCLAVIGHTAFTASRMTVSLAAIALQAPTFVVGLLLSLYALLPMLLSVAAGRWIDRVGTRLPMLLGSVVVSVGFVLPALWLTLPMLFINSLLVGTGFMFFHLSIQKLTGDLAEGPQRMRNFAHLAVGYSVSAFCGPISAGILIDWSGAGSSFGAAFLASTLLIVAAFGVPAIWTRLRDNVSEPETLGEFETRGIMTNTGRLTARDATTQVLILPVLLVCWGLAVAVIAAIVA